MDILITLLKDSDPINILAMGLMLWIFKGSLDKRFDKIDAKFEKFDEQIKELRTSLNRMEGAFYSKECCMLKDDKQNRKMD